MSANPSMSDNPSDEIASVNSSVKNFSDFEQTRILSENTQAKTITVLGKFGGIPGQAIVLLQKSCFIHDHLPNFFTGKTILNKEFHNDIYGTYDCQPPPELNGINATIIHPATEKHIAKYEAKPGHVIEETPALYASVTLPHLNAEQFNLQWVYNIIEGSAEQDRVVYASPASEEKTGFILVPDLKWDGKNIENLHLIALPYMRGILSLRDLNNDHLPLLRNINIQGKKAVEEKFGLSASQLRIFLHYQPSFYHLHIHFTSLRHEAFGIHAGKAHLLTSVINNLELLSSYYRDAILPFFVKESDNLFSKFEKQGKILAFSESSKKLKLPQLKLVIMTAKEMVNRTVVKSLVCELRPRLCTGNVFLQTTQRLTRVDASSDVGHIILSLAGADWSGLVVIAYPHHFSFTPSGFQIDDDSLTFTVVFEPVDKRVGSSSAQVLRVTQTENGTLKLSGNFSPPPESCHPKCRQCGSLVWEDRTWKFERVLELPSTPLEEVAGEWFCHGHGESLSWTPKHTDCFHDHLSTVIYLKGSAPGIVSCHKCQAWLGSVNKYNMCRLWGFTVKWEDVGGSPWLNLPSSPSEAFLVAIRQTTLEECNLKPIMKILIETQLSDSHRNWLLLCILNGDLKVLLAADEEGQGGPHDEIGCDGEKSNEMLELGWSALLTEKQTESDVAVVLQDWKSHLDDFPIKVPLCPQTMKRVLFKEENELAGICNWENNSSIAMLKVAAPMYYAGIDHLRRWNQLLPHKQRSCDGFNISYLEL